MEKITIKNKKGFLRILEAFIAVLLIAGVLLFVINRGNNNKDSLEESIFEIEKSILKEISQNDPLRRAILEYNGTQNTFYDLKVFAINKIDTQRFAIEFNICPLDQVCGLPQGIQYPNADVYSQSVPIASDLQGYNPKVVKIFVWEK
jgi:hypothetical protein